MSTALPSLQIIVTDQQADRISGCGDEINQQRYAQGGRALQCGIRVQGRVDQRSHDTRDQTQLRGCAQAAEQDERDLGIAAPPSSVHKLPAGAQRSPGADPLQE